MRTLPCSSSTTRRAQAGLTLMECVIIVAVLAAFVLFVAIPNIARSRQPSCRIDCVNNLKNIGLAFRTAAVDSGEFSFRLPEDQGGTLPWQESAAEVWRHFAALSNELSTPKIVACPRDVRRSKSNTWSSVIETERNRAISYTLGIDASETTPQSILSSDRNLEVDGAPVSETLIRLKADTAVTFDSRIHGKAGNLLMGDGSVMQVASGRLRQDMAAASAFTTNETVRLLVP